MSVSLTVMTFNLHDDEPPDSPNSWDKRRDLCISVITSYSPTILCTQQGSFFSFLLSFLCWFGSYFPSGYVQFRIFLLPLDLLFGVWFQCSIFVSIDGSFFVLLFFFYFLHLLLWFSLIHLMCCLDSLIRCEISVGFSSAGFAR